MPADSVPTASDADFVPVEDGLKDTPTSQCAPEARLAGQEWVWRYCDASTPVRPMLHGPRSDALVFVSLTVRIAESVSIA